MNTTEYREIPLTQGKSAIVDAGDFEWLSQWKWCAQWSDNTQSFYAIRVAIVEGKRIAIKMHRLILGLHKGDRRLGDHWNHDTLDNRRGNLRIATVAQNNRNSRMPRTNTSGFKGVSWHKHMRKWRASIRISTGQLKTLGYYPTAQEAAAAYAKAAAEVYREFSHVPAMVESGEAIDTVRSVLSERTQST